LVERSWLQRDAVPNVVMELDVSGGRATLDDAYRSFYPK